MGEAKRRGLKVRFDRRLRREFDGGRITSDAGLPARREGGAQALVAAKPPGEADKIGGRIVRYTQQIIFQLVEVAVSREVFALILDRINRLRPVPV